MSFATDVSNELLSVPLSKTCCRKAILFGMFFCAKHPDSNVVSVEFKTNDSAQRAAQILKAQFSLDAQIEEKIRAGRKIFEITAKTKAISNFLDEIDTPSNSKTLSQIIGFRCAECTHAFLRGVFLSCGTVSDPRKGYHFEFSIKSDARAQLLRDFLEAEGNPPKLIKRGEKTGLYYKSSSAIMRVIYYIGGVKSSFEIPNAGLVKDLRNEENRATNCVTTNISRAVEASRKQVEAIEKLKSSGALVKLSAELRYTAELRLSNPSAPLSELALMHEPPISKSGLNRRIVKLMQLSNEI